MRKYVVLWNLVANEFTRGQVVSGAALGERLTRALDLGSVRPAAPAEAKLERVSLEEPARHQSLEQQLADKDAEIARFRARVAELEVLKADLEALKAKAPRQRAARTAQPPETAPAAVTEPTE